MLVTGILNICFAALGLLGGLWGLVSIFLPIPGTEATRDLYKDPAFLAVVLGFGLLSLASRLVMAISGLGLVRGKAWGRSLGNLWAVFSMVYGLAFAVVQGVYVLPKTFAAIQSQPGAGQQQAQMMNSMEDLAVLTTIVSGVLMAVVYQIIFLFLNNRKVVRSYLEHQRSRQMGEPGSGALEGRQAVAGTSPWDGQG